jgi:hypothetical protein
VFEAVSSLDQFMIPTRLDTSEVPDDLVLLIIGIALAAIVVVVAGAVVMDYVDKAKQQRSKK